MNLLTICHHINLFSRFIYKPLHIQYYEKNGLGLCFVYSKHKAWMFYDNISVETLPLADSTVIITRDFHKSHCQLASMLFRSVVFYSTLCTCPEPQPIHLTLITRRIRQRKQIK